MNKLLRSLLQADGALSRQHRARIARAVDLEMAQRLTDLMCISTYWGL